jgi:hypothetical protein
VSSTGLLAVGGQRQNNPKLRLACLYRSHRG